MVKDLREKDQTTEVLWSVIRNDLRANGTFDRYAVVWVSVVVAANEVYLVSSSVSKSDRIGDKVKLCSLSKCSKFEFNWFHNNKYYKDE